MSRFSLPLLFGALTAIFAAIAVSGASHGKWVIAVASAVIALWMGSFAWAGLRRMRR